MEAHQPYCITRPTTPLGQPRKIAQFHFFRFSSFPSSLGNEAHSSIPPNLGKKFQYFCGKKDFLGEKVASKSARPKKVT
nr:unnamed protein product [Meloidogyne enterolobii]